MKALYHMLRFFGCLLGFLLLGALLTFHFFTGRGGRLGRRTRSKFLYATSGVEDLLFASVEGMTVCAQFNLNFFHG